MKTLALFIAAFFVASCSVEPEAPLVASGISIKMPRPGMSMSVAYLTITNNSEAPIALTSVNSPQFDRIEIHETVIENDVARMRRLDSVIVPAGGSLALAPGGKHLMMMQPQSSIETLMLHFYADDQLVLSVSATPGGD